MPALLEDLGEWAVPERRSALACADGKSGARLERVVVGGQAFVLKRQPLADDWTARTVGDLGCATAALWERGLFEHMPRCVRVPIVAVIAEPSVWPRIDGVTLVMEDVADWLVPEGGEPVDEAQHLRFVDHMAAMHAAFWDAGPQCELTPLSHRYLALSPWLARTEMGRGDPPLVPRLVGEGWARLLDVAPELAATVLPLAEAPWPLLDALAGQPLTLVHGNWKFGNLGSDHDGRTLLIDWEEPGRAPGMVDLAWYLAINCDRLPITKEATIDVYREGLERGGVITGDWWEPQVDLCLLGAIVQFGWEKALGGPGAEVDWWTDRALRARRWLAG